MAIIAGAGTRSIEEPVESVAPIVLARPYAGHSFAQVDTAAHLQVSPPVVLLASTWPNPLCHACLCGLRVLHEHLMSQLIELALHLVVVHLALAADLG